MGGGLCRGRTCGSNGGGAARRRKCYGDSDRVAGFGIDVGRVRVESCERVSLVVTFSNSWKGRCIDRVLIGRIARASAEYRPDKDG